MEKEKLIGGDKKMLFTFITDLTHEFLGTTKKIVDKS